MPPARPLLALIPLLLLLLPLLAAAAPPPEQPLVLDVTARQWWWEIHYEAENPADEFDAANEIHIPAGRPVILRLQAAIAVPGFSIPPLTAATDLVPGETSTHAIQADQSGRYLSQCSGWFCSPNAHMQLEVDVQSPDDFNTWVAQQRTATTPPATAAAARGLELLQDRCALCHALRGVTTGSVSGPDLTHLMSRRLLAAGTLPNSRAGLSLWIQDPQDAKPGSLMPREDLSAHELNDLLAYLQTLK